MLVIPVGILRETTRPLQEINLQQDESSDEDYDTPLYPSSSEFVENCEEYTFVIPYTPNRGKCQSKLPNRATSSHGISSVRARLIANQLIKFDKEPDFHDFMTRFHCLPYATDFKFEVNMHINEYYAMASERSLKARQQCRLGSKNSENLLSKSLSTLLTICEEAEAEIAMINVA